MPRKTSVTRTSRSPRTPKATTKRSTKSAAKARTQKTTPKKVAAKKRTSGTTRSKTSAQPTKKTASKPVSRRRSSGSSRKSTTSQVPLHQALERAESDIAGAVETLNNQMNAALEVFTKLASVHAEPGRAIIRTAPLDRATATFHRLVSEVVDDQMAEMLPPLVALRNEMSQRADAGSTTDVDGHELYARVTETLDHVLTLADVQSYDARPGDTFDPLIHLAVGETHRHDLPDGTVAEPLQPGFRSARGKVVVPAKVRINRR